MSDSPQDLAAIRGRGRPKADEPRTAVTSWIPVDKYDQLVRLANHRGLSVSSLVKVFIVQGVTPKR